MRVPACLGILIVFLANFAPVEAQTSYFVITSPTQGSRWANGATNYATWTIGAGGDISAFDVELTRGAGSLTFVARNVPTNAHALPISLTDVPPADDYYLVFLNVTHGLMYSVSQRFSILPAGQEPNAATPANVGKLPTVSVSGAPNPTSSFAYTFAPTSRANTRTCVNASVLWLLASVLMLWTAL